MGELGPRLQAEPPSNSVSSRLQPAPQSTRPSRASPLQMRLKRLALNPAEEFGKAYATLESWPDGTAEAHFPPGFHARVAPDLLVFLYSTARRAKDVLFDWLKDRSLLGNNNARGLLAMGTLLDIMLLDEPIPNFINSILVERVAKKTYALMVAYQEVLVEEDWKRPAGCKHWASNICWEKAMRIDPDLQPDGQVLRIPLVQREISSQLRREAAEKKLRDQVERIHTSI